MNIYCIRCGGVLKVLFVMIAMNLMTARLLKGLVCEKFVRPVERDGRRQHYARAHPCRREKRKSN